MKHKISLLICMSMLLSACVTINIYFPAAEAQEVADEIIDEVWQLKGGKEDDETTTPAADEVQTETNSTSSEEAQ